MHDRATQRLRRVRIGIVVHRAPVAQHARKDIDQFLARLDPLTHTEFGSEKVFKWRRHSVFPLALSRNSASLVGAAQSPAGIDHRIGDASSNDRSRRIHHQPDTVVTRRESMS